MFDEKNVKIKSIRIDGKTLEKSKYSFEDILFKENNLQNKIYFKNSKRSFQSSNLEKWTPKSLTFKCFKFCIEKDFFQNDIFNILSGNFTVNQILNFIRKYQKKINVKLVNSEIMNQLSYHVSKEKIQNEGLYLNYNIENDIKNTIKLLGNI